MSRFWACAQTHPRNEQLAVRNLHRQRFTAFYPFFLVKNRFSRMTVQPVFPSYVFVELDDDVLNWPPINYTTGVKQLLTCTSTHEYRHPAHIGFVDSLRRLRIWNQAAESSADRIPVGTMVKITRGPFAQKVGLVEMSTHDRVRLLMDAFNRTCSVDFDVTAVEALC